MRVRPFPLLPRDENRNIETEQERASQLMPQMLELLNKGRSATKADRFKLAKALKFSRTAAPDTSAWSITKPEESDGSNAPLAFAFNAYVLEMTAQNEDVFVMCVMSLHEHTVALFGSTTEKLFYLLDLTKSRLFVNETRPESFDSIFQTYYGKVVVHYQCYAMERKIN